MTKTTRRLMKSCAALLLAAGLAGCAGYDDGYGPGYYNGGGYSGGGYYGGSSVVYTGGGGYRPHYYHDNDRHEHRPVHYRQEDNDRGRWNNNGNRENRSEWRRDSGRSRSSETWNGN